MKSRIKITAIILILVLNVLLYFIPSSYKKSYKRDGYQIMEKYDNKHKIYTFNISKNDSFSIAINKSYIYKKGLINKIKAIKLDNGYCVIPESKKIDFYPLCKIDGNLISYHLVPELKDKINSSYYKNIENINVNSNKIEVSATNNKKIFVWNYNYFYYIHDDKIDKIKLFDNDYYQIELAAKINNYLFIPNYDQGFSFDSAYVLNMKNGKKEKWTLPYEISIDSRIVGTNRKSIFLVDNKNKIMYEIVPHKKKIRKVSGKILEGNTFKSYNINKIINNNMYFKPYSTWDYKIANGRLYQIIDDKKTIISSGNITDIIYKNKDEVYYLIDDTIYLYSPYYGNIKLISNFEWEFNYKNLIFIY